MLWFILGFVAGTIFGFILAAALAAGSNADDVMEAYHKSYTDAERKQ